jgi:hypothetical protein
MDADNWKLWMERLVNAANIVLVNVNRVVAMLTKALCGAESIAALTSWFCLLVVVRLSVGDAGTFRQSLGSLGCTQKRKSCLGNKLIVVAIIIVLKHIHYA